MRNIYRLKKKLFKIIIILGLFLLPFFLRIPSLTFPLDYDAGGHIFYGMDVAKNGFYMTLQEIRPVGLLTIFALIYKLFGTSTFWVNTTGAFFWVIATFFLCKIILTFYKSEKIAFFSILIFIFLSASRSVQGEMVNLETFFIPFNLIGIYVFLIARKKNKLFLFSFSGLFFGLAFLIKQLAVFDLIGLLFYFYFTELFLKKGEKKFDRNFIELLKETIFVFFGFVFPTLIYTIYFQLNGKLSDFFNYQFLTIFKNTRTNLQAGSALNNFRRSFSVIFKKTSIFWILTLLGTINIIFYKKEVKRYFPIFWLIIDFLGVYYLWWFFLHHFLQILPMISIISGLFIVDVLEVIKKSKKINTKYKNKFSITVFLVFLTFFILNDFKYFSSYFIKISGKIDWKTHMSLVGFDVGPAGYCLYDVGKYLNSVTNKEEKIYAWVSFPFIYALADREPVSWFVYKYPLLPENLTFIGMKGWFNDYTKNRKKLINELSNNPPRYIIIFVDPEHAFDEMLSFQDFSKLVSENYLFDKQIGNYLIFKKGNRPKLPENITNIVPVELIKRFSQIISVEKNKGSQNISFIPMVNSNGVARLLRVSTSLDDLKFEELKIISMEIGKEDYVGFSSLKPSGSSDLHVKVKGLNKPVSFVKVAMSDFSWNSESYGVNSIVKVVQDNDIFDLYMEPTRIVKGNKVEVYIIYQTGEIARNSASLNF